MATADYLVFLLPLLLLAFHNQQGKQLIDNTRPPRKTSLNSTGSTSSGCSDILNITESNIELLVNTTLTPICIQCLDHELQTSTTTTWILRRHIVVTPGAIAGVDVLGGTLIFQNYSIVNKYKRGLSCFSSIKLFSYANIDLFPACKDLNIILIISFNMFCITALLLPKVSVSSTPALEGTDVFALCHHNNARSLNTTVTWLDPDGTELPAVDQAGIVLLLRNITKSQEGNYSCELTSNRGETVAVSFPITVVQ